MDLTELITYNIMAQELIYIVLFTLLLSALDKPMSFLIYKISPPAYDHSYHINLIKGIKANKHKFNRNSPCYITEKNFFYPQLYHWFLSFLPINTILNRYKSIEILISTLSTFIVLFISYLFHILYVTNIPLVPYLALISLIYWSTPFKYYVWNAKNRGLSPRGLGIFLGFLYQLGIFLFVNEPTVPFFIGLVLITIIIILASQFTMQFVILSSPIFSIFYDNYWIIFSVIVAFILFVVFSYKQAISYFKGQYYHKKIWLTHLTKVILKHQRHSIWRDFIYDFQKKKDLKYFLSNSVIIVVYGIPGLILLMFVIINNKYNNIPIEGGQNFLLIHIITSFILFILTSFRKTRFLGEPERYMEFSVPFIAIMLVINYWHYQWILLVLIVISISLIAYHLAIFGFQKYNAPENIAHFKELIDNQTNEALIKVFSNNTSLLNYFIDNLKYKILQPDISYEYTGSFHFKDIFKEHYFKICPSTIFPLIKEFKINWFILDTNWLNEDLFKLEDQNICLTKVHQIKDYILYSVSHYELKS